MITGWLTPSGEFIQCKTYEHIQVTQSNPLFAKFEPKIGEVLKHIEDVEKDCQEQAERQGASHAEWHTYEMACDRAKDKIWKLLLNRGFIRVGEGEESTLCFEGRPHHLKKQHQICKDFADSYGADAIFEPQK